MLEVVTVKKNILNDSNLEALNIIKEIDTLSIINKADEILKQKEAKRINFIGMTICMLLIIFNVVTVFFLGLKIFAILQVFMLWISPIFIILFIKKLSVKEELKWH